MLKLEECRLKLINNDKADLASQIENAIIITKTLPNFRINKLFINEKSKIKLKIKISNQSNVKNKFFLFI